MGFHGLVRATEGVDLFLKAKKDTIRPLDRRDAAALRERFGLSED